MVSWRINNTKVSNKEKLNEMDKITITEPTKPHTIHDVIERFSGENLMKLQKHFVSLYGSDEMAKEKANSFAVGFSKACELMIKELNAI